MSNKYLEHLQVLVEDDANRQLINGLSQNHSVQLRRLQVLPPAGGWYCVLEALTDAHRIRDMNAYHKRHLLLLIDFDDQFDARLKIYQGYKEKLEPATADRVYLLGCLHEPEALKAAFNHCKPIEQLGRELSEDCAEHSQNVWQHAHLQHNANELKRVVSQVKPFLFAP